MGNQCCSNPSEGTLEKVDVLSSSTPKELPNEGKTTEPQGQPEEEPDDTKDADFEKDEKEGEAEPQALTLVSSDDEPAININIVGARGLRNADWLPGTGKSDTYVIVKMDGQQLYRTQVIKDTLEPFWREEFSIPTWTQGQIIEFHLYDEDFGSSDYLGNVFLDGGTFASSGFNGELSIAEAGDGVQAYLRLKVKIAGKELPPGPPTDVVVTAEKGACLNWGLDLDTQDNEILFVTEVRPGPFMDANEHLLPEQQIIKTDFIVSVNNVKGSPAALLNEFKMSQTVSVEVSRSIETAIIFEYKDKKLPLGIEFPKKPAGETLVILGIEEGGAGEAHNKAQTNEMLKLNVGDRIISVHGVRGKAGELLDQMERTKKKGKHQVIVVRPTNEEAKHHFGLH